MEKNVFIDDSHTSANSRLSCLTSMNLSFHIYKTGIIMPNLRIDKRIKGRGWKIIQVIEIT